MSKIPPNWQVKSLGEVAEVIAGQISSPSIYNYKQAGFTFFQGKVDICIIFPKVREWCSKPIDIEKPKVLNAN